jgi:hypothetical protein
MLLHISSAKFNRNLANDRGSNKYDKNISMTRIYVHFIRILMSTGVFFLGDNRNPIVDIRMALIRKMLRISLQALYIFA